MLYLADRFRNLFPHRLGVKNSRRYVPLLIQCLAAVALFWLVTSGTGRFPHHGFFLSKVYDSVARSLLDLKTDVDPHEIKNEAFVVNGRVHTYFGIFPALLRVIPNALFPAYYGQWNRISCFLASLLCLLSFHALVRVRLDENPRLTAGQKTHLQSLLGLGFALGTPIVFILSSSFVYHEAIIWGLAGSTSAIFFFFKLLSRWSASSELLFSCSVAVALLSRASFGLALLPAHVALYLWQRRTYAVRRELPKFWTISPLVLGLLLQCWVNHDRFGNIATFVDLRYNQTAFPADQASQRIRNYEKYGIFNARRIPTNLAHYFGVQYADYSDSFPFIRMTMPEVPVGDLYEHREPTLPLTVSTPWLLLFGATGLTLSLRKGMLEPPVVLLLVCLLGQGALILMFHSISERYVAEVLPFLATAGVTGLPWLYRPGPRTCWVSRVFDLLLPAFISASIYISFTSALAWIGEYLRPYPGWAVPGSFSRSVGHFLEAVNDLLR
ncbi:MAG TPA: hypothetical protein VGT40_05015 [Methylomirabilota bacterium]|nr:hypothetical protein [Methylomirabilota bacterium]